MTYARREEIFSKEALTNQDLAELFDVCESSASQKAKEIRRVVGDRLGIQGRVHVQDYLDYMQIKAERMDMYRKPQKEVEMPRKSVCWGG
jgi:hypothetical protein